jgi:hypothetical protein
MALWQRETLGKTKYYSPTGICIVIPQPGVIIQWCGIPRRNKHRVDGDVGKIGIENKPIIANVVFQESNDSRAVNSTESAWGSNFCGRPLGQLELVLIFF